MSIKPRQPHFTLSSLRQSFESEQQRWDEAQFLNSSGGIDSVTVVNMFHVSVLDLCFTFTSLQLSANICACITLHFYKYIFLKLSITRGELMN